MEGGGIFTSGTAPQGAGHAAVSRKEDGSPELGAAALTARFFWVPMLLGWQKSVGRSPNPAGVSSLRWAPHMCGPVEPPDDLLGRGFLPTAQGQPQPWRAGRPRAAGLGTRLARLCRLRLCPRLSTSTKGALAPVATVPSPPCKMPERPVWARDSVRSSGLW